MLNKSILESIGYLLIDYSEKAHESAKLKVIAYNGMTFLSQYLKLNFLFKDYLTVDL